MALLPGDDHHTHVKYTDAYGASAIQESLQAVVDRLDNLESNTKLLFANIVDIQNRLEALENQIKADLEGGE